MKTVSIVVEIDLWKIPTEKKRRPFYHGICPDIGEFQDIAYFHTAQRQIFHQVVIDRTKRAADIDRMQHPLTFLTGEMPVIWDLHCHHLTKVIQLVDAAIHDAEIRSAVPFLIDDLCVIRAARRTQVTAKLQRDRPLKVQRIQQLPKSGQQRFVVIGLRLLEVFHVEARSKLQFLGHIAMICFQRSDQIIDIAQFFLISGKTSSLSSGTGREAVSVLRSPVH